MALQNFCLVMISVVSAFIVLTYLTGFTEAVQNNKSQLKDYGCLCADYSCGCCVHLDVPKIRLNDTGCVNITYLYKEYGISFTMTLDNLTIYNETISARNPPPICFGAPYLERFADLCVHFYDIDASKTKLHGCVDIEARMHKIVVARYKVGCFNLGKKGLNWRWKKYHRFLVGSIRIRQNMLNISKESN